MLLAFAWQSFLTQTHVHPAASAPWESSAAHDARSAGASRHERPAGSPADCPICHDLAQAGHYISPAPIALDPFVEVVVGVVATVLIQGISRARPQQRRSRDPPEPLQV